MAPQLESPDERDFLNTLHCYYDTEDLQHIFAIEIFVILIHYGKRYKTDIWNGYFKHVVNKLF